jgi:transcriptional antiterminator RfaH
MPEHANIWNNLNWFAVQAKPHQESLAAARIAKLDLEVFLPRVKRWKSVGGVPRWLTQQLFPGYFFSRFVPSVSLDAVRFSMGVLRVVGGNQFPIPVDAETVADLQARVCADGLIALEDTKLIPGDTVRIEQGPFEGFVGKVEREMDDGKRVAILLEALAHAHVLIEKHCVEKAAAI